MSSFSAEKGNYKIDIKDDTDLDKANNKYSL